MSGASALREDLRAECTVFCRYLIGRDPSDYVIRCYERAWASAAQPGASAHSFIDRSLLSLARRGALPARIADGYTRLFRPFSGLRRRLILLLAILENSPPSAGPLNSAREGRVGSLLAGVTLTLLASAGCLLAGIVVLGPLHVVSLLSSRQR